MIEGAVVNALDFGADTAAANNSTAFQAAIDSLASGGVVYIPEGTYTLTTGVSIPSNVTVQGAGSTTIITSASNIDLFYSTGTTGSRKTNLAFRDIKLVKTAGTGDFVKLTYVDDSLLENVEMVGFGTGNRYMRLAGTRRCVVSGCRGTTMAQLIMAGSDGSGNSGDYGEDNVVESSYFVGGSQGVTIQRQTRLRCVAVTSNNNGSATNPYGVGFDIEGAACNNLVFESCVANGNYEGGFWVEGSGTGIDQCQFVGCIATNNKGGSSGSGFAFMVLFRGISMTGCLSVSNNIGVTTFGNREFMISNSIIANNDAHGIRTYNAYLSSITGNLIKGNVDYGINIQEDPPFVGTTQALTIANNTIVDNTLGAVYGFAYSKGYYDNFGVQQYTPTLTGSTSGSATLSNAYGYFQIFQGKCTGRIYIANSSGSTLSGEWRFSLPATAASGTAQGGSGAVTYTRALPTSANATYYFLDIAASTNYGTLKWGYNNGTEGAAVTGAVASNVICTIDFEFYVA